MKRLIAMLLALVLALAMCACGSEEENENSENEAAEHKTVRTVADPEGALEEIYAQLERKTGLVDADDDIVSDVMGFDLKLSTNIISAIWKQTTALLTCISSSRQRVRTKTSAKP